MSVQALELTDMTAEELLAEMVLPEISEYRAERLRERIVEMHRPLAMEIARRYRYRGEPLEDLLQAAYVGLMKAINGFDPTLGHAFRGYAVVTMTGEVKRHFRDRTQDLGRAPTVAELAVKMRISEEDVLLTLDASAAYSALSLDAPLGADDD